MQQTPSISELERTIEVARRRSQDPSLPKAEREIFAQALTNATAMRDQLMSPSTQPPAPALSFRQETTVASAAAHNAPQHFAAAAAAMATGTAAQAQAPAEKKKAAPRRASVRTAAGGSQPDVVEEEGAAKVITVQSSFQPKRVVLSFQFTGRNARELQLSPAQVVSRLKTSIGQVAGLKRKTMEESTDFFTALTFYTGLRQYYGRPLTPKDLRLKGGKPVMQVFQKLQQMGGDV